VKKITMPFVVRFLLPTFLFFSSHVSANPVVIIESGICAACQNHNQHVGWNFDVLEPLVVTGLGWYSSNGIHWHHRIWLYDANGTELATVYIPDSGAVGTYIDGQFRTSDVGPVLLTPGVGYRIEGENYYDSIEILAYNPTFSWIDPRISYSDNGVHGIFGPSFSVAPATIPLPGAFWLFGSGLVWLIGVAQCKKTTNA
jgi:hypothetical protein